MNFHATNKDLAAFLAGTMKPRKRERFEGHIRTCVECGKRHSTLKAAIAPRYKTIELNDQMLERILVSWREIKSWSPATRYQDEHNFIRRYPRTVIAASVAAVVIIIASLMIRPVESSRIAMTVGNAGIGITVNDKPLAKGMKVYDSGRIRLPDKAMMRLVHGDIVNITLVDKCDLSIDEFVRDNEDRIMLRGNLHDGVLISSIHSDDMRITYVYETPNATIESLGTEFLLQTAEGMTLLIMGRDSVKVTATRSGETFIVPAGKKCIISDSISIMTAANGDLKLLGNLDALRNGAYDHLLLPSAGKVQQDKEKGRWQAGTRETLDKDAAEGDARKQGDNSGYSEAEKQKDHEILDREARQLRMEQKKQQMNEMRRYNRTNMNQQMRRGR